LIGQSISSVLLLFLYLTAFQTEPEGTPTSPVSTNSAPLICEFRYPDLSPDGRRIVYVGLYCDNSGEDIFVMDSDGANVHFVTRGKELKSSPLWSPDSHKILFVSLKDTQDTLVVTQEDGSDPIEVTHTPANQIEFVQWSPDGKHILLSFRDQSATTITTVEADGTNRVDLLKRRGTEACARWSPDGTQILFTLHEDRPTADIFRMSADGSNLLQLTHDTADKSCPEWSPDGSSFVFSRRDEADFWKLIRMDPDGSHEQEIVLPEDIVAIFGIGVIYSPDGKHLALTFTGGMLSHLVIVNSDGSDPVWINDGNGRNDYPSWSPDDDYLVFSSDMMAYCNVYRVNADGTHMLKLSHNPYYP
jgi:Tol biopolymer transport system component